MNKVRRITPTNAALLQLCICCALVALAALAKDAGAAPPYPSHPRLVIQCAGPGHCERFVLRAHPKVGDLKEGTAKHRVKVETCILFGTEAQDCTVKFVSAGDQIIAWDQS